MTQTGTPPAETPLEPEPQDPLAVPMDHVITNGSGTGDGQEKDTADPAEVLPEDPEEQNDLA